MDKFRQFGLILVAAAAVACNKNGGAAQSNHAPSAPATEPAASPAAATATGPAFAWDLQRVHPWNGSHCVDFEADDEDEEAPQNEEECVSYVCSEMCTHEGARWEQACAEAKAYFDSQNQGQDSDDDDDDDDDDGGDDGERLSDDDPDDPTDSPGDECWYRGGGRCSERCNDDEGHRDWLVRVHSEFRTPEEHFALVEEYDNVWALHCQHVGALIEMFESERDSSGDRSAAASATLEALLQEAKSQQERCYGEEDVASFSLRPMAERWSAYVAAEQAGAGAAGGASNKGKGKGKGAAGAGGASREGKGSGKGAASPGGKRSSAYGGSLLKAESLGVSAGFHRWLGRVGTHYGDCIGAVLLVAVDEPWLGNHFYFGAVFATAVGQYGDPDAANIFAAAASTSEYLDEGRSFGGTAALPPLDFSYSTLAARAGYRLLTRSFISGGAYVDLGYGLVGTVDDAQMNGFVAIGANVIVKFFPTLIMTLGLQYRQDIPAGQRIAGFEDMSALAIYNSFELVKF